MGKDPSPAFQHKIAECHILIARDLNISDESSSLFLSDGLSRLFELVMQGHQRFRVMSESRVILFLLDTYIPIGLFNIANGLLVFLVCKSRAYLHLCRNCSRS